MTETTDELACPKCKTRDDLVVVGLDMAAMLGRYSSDEENAAQWAVRCFGCKSKYAINDETRDALFGTAWRDA